MHVQGEPPALRHGRERVFENIQERLAHLAGDGEDGGRRVGLEVDLVADASPRGLVVPLRPRKRQQLLEHVAQLHRFGTLHPRRPRVFLEPPHRLHAVGGALVDDGERVLELVARDRLVGVEPLLEHLRPAEHRGEPVVDVVGDAGGQRAEGAELLLADDPEAQLVLAADVAEDADALDAAAVVPLGRRQRGQHRPRIARAREQEHLALERRRAHLRGEHGHVLGAGQEVRPADTDQRVAGADHLVEGAVGEDDAVVAVGDHDALADAPDDVGQLARLVLEARVLDGHRRAIGHDAQQPVGATAEPPRATRHLEHADGEAGHDQRGHHQRAERLAARQRLAHAAGALGDEDGLAGGDGRGHRADAHRDRRRLDAGRQADGRARTQLGARLVQHVDDGDVGVEHLDDDLDQAEEQELGAGRSERGLRDAAQRLQLARAPRQELARDQRARARDDLLGQERLGHVVVGALAQAPHAG